MVPSTLLPVSARAAGALLLLAAAPLACGSGAPKPPAQLLDSRVREPAIDVDGYREDWEGNLTRVGDTEVFAGFHREGDALYVALVSQDRGFDARVFRSGLTVWFDPAAMRARSVGVRFPVFDAGARKRLSAETAGGGPDRERLLEIAGPDFVLVRDSTEERRVAPDDAAGGFEVAAAVDRGLFTWEARVPLAGTSGTGSGLPVSASDTISVGLQAGGDQGELARAPADSAAAGDSLRAGRGDSARGRAAAAGPGLREVPVLEAWVRVRLGQDEGT